MGIKQSNDGLWEAFYSKRHPITRQPVTLRRIKLKTKAEALRVEKELVLQVESKLHCSIVPAWKQVVVEWETFAVDSGMGAGTILAYKKCLEAHTLPIWGDRTVDVISDRDIRAVVQNPEKEWSQGHRKNMLKYIRSVFNYAFERQYINRVPVPKMKFRIVTSMKGGLSEGQAKLFLERAQELEFEWFPHWALALYTGMRSGELYALKWDCIDLEAGIILVKLNWTSKTGFKPPKNWEERTIDVAPALLSLLKKLRLQTYDMGFVLPRIVDWDRGEQARIVRTFLAGMGLPPMRFHDLRASWTTLLLSKGVEPIKVMALGGWKDLKTMMRYVRIAGVDLKGTTSCLNLHSEERKTGKLVAVNFGGGAT